jgi:hypothetical protein
MCFLYYISYPSKHFLTLAQVTCSFSLRSLVTSDAQKLISSIIERLAKLASPLPPPISTLMASSQMGKISKEKIKIKLHISKILFA